MILIEANETMVQEYLTENDVIPVFQQLKKTDDGSISCLYRVHWVALTSKYQFDDADHYNVANHQSMQVTIMVNKLPMIK